MGPAEASKHPIISSLSHLEGHRLVVVVLGMIDGAEVRLCIVDNLMPQLKPSLSEPPAAVTLD